MLVSSSWCSFSKKKRKPLCWCLIVDCSSFSANLAEADENGERHMLLCRVILGNVEKVEAGSRQCYPSNVGFDSGSDDLNNPKWYIVWSRNMNTHILPECVVSFKSSNEVQGKFNCFYVILRFYSLLFGN